MPAGQAEETSLGLHLNPGTTSDKKNSARKITSGEPCTTSMLTSCSHPISDHLVERTSTRHPPTRKSEHTTTHTPVRCTSLRHANETRMLCCALQALLLGTLPSPSHSLAKSSFQPSRGGSPHLVWQCTHPLDTSYFDRKAQSLCDRSQVAILLQSLHPITKLPRDPRGGSLPNFACRSTHLMHISCFDSKARSLCNVSQFMFYS